MTMLLNKEEIDDSILQSIPDEMDIYFPLHKTQLEALIKAQLKKVFEKLEEQVFYVDNRGFIALKPNATKNWQALKKEVEG